MMQGELLPMPDRRRSRLKELEEVIESGWAEVVRVGQALREIRDERLYTELGAVTFEHYCRSRWSLPKSSAYKKIDAAAIQEATSRIPGPLPISSEHVGMELAPLLRAGGADLVADAWTKVSERYRDQRPPTATEVHRILVQEGYRQDFGSPSIGPPNARILLGLVGDRIAAAEKRLDWFLHRDVPKAKKVAPSTRQAAAGYADRLDAMAGLLRQFAEGDA